MAKNARNLTIFSFFACFWLTAVLTPVYGAGGKDTDLSRADQLIAEREYDQAIQFLTEAARKNPNQFDQVQARLNQIYLAREEFNKTADELINLLLNDYDDDEKIDEKILALTIKLKSLENDNSPILVDFLSRIHEISLFNVSRNQLRRALERGREMLDRGDYEAALAAYAGGFVIMREEFYAANYSAAIHNQTRQETERLNTVTAAFRQTANQLETVTAEVTRAINSGQHGRVPEIMPRLISAIDAFIAQKQNIYAAAAALDRNLQSLQRANPTMGDRNHIAFILRVIYGRTDADIQEGILGAFDGLWNKATGSCLNAITQYYETTNNTALNSFNRQDYNGVANTLAGIAAYSDIIPIFFEKHRQLTQATTAQTVTFNGLTIPRDGLSHYLRLNSLIEASTALRQAANIPGREQYDRNTLVNLRNRRITAPEALAIEQRTRDYLLGQKNEIQTIRTRAVQIDTQISALQEFPYIKNAVSAIDALLARITTEEQQSAQRYYNIAQSDLEHNIAQMKVQMEKARSLMEGELRYPAEALQELTPMLASANQDIERGSTLLTQLRNEPPGIASNAEIRTLSNRYQTSVNELTTIRDQGQTMAATARSRAAQAESLRREGERLFAEAQTAYQRQNYETSVERIDRASQRFDESLALQESAEVREFRDTQLGRLGQQIAAAQNETILVEVRNLVNSARNSYFEGNFQRAEDNLLRAQNRWRLIYLEDDDEITHWLNMVQRAMSASSARVIPPTAPLYPEMSQLLSQARRNYDEGVRLINTGQRERGISKFDEARVQTREVKLMFPVNQEAGILELRMEQFTDPRAFNAAFEQRLATARAGTQRRSIQAYADLLNLAEINPNYPGIRNIVTQAEIDMGIRPPPTPQADIVRSRELTASATHILETNNVSQFPAAIILINEAIRLDSGNTNAPRIKDRLLSRTNTNETRTAVLSREDEAQYATAVRELQAGNNLIAYGIVERLLQKPENRSVTKLIDLQRRIQL
jgi:adenosyl cobinamide kinase/adenosyl cobinamide phosphate guanylyltransferase